MQEIQTRKGKEVAKYSEGKEAKGQRCCVDGFC